MISRVGPQETPYQYYTRTGRDARITALILGILTLLFLAVSCILWGLGTLPAHVLMGFGGIPYLCGIFLSLTGLGLFIGSIGFSIAAAVRSAQSQAILRISS